MKIKIYILYKEATICNESNIKYCESWKIFQEINLLGPVALLLESVFEVVTAS